MDFSSNLRGVICAAPTPFMDDGRSIDWQGLRSNALWLVDQGVRMIVVNGSIGEYASIARRNRIRIVPEAVAAVDGRAIIVAGCSHTSPASVLEICEQAEVDGAQGVMLSLPYYFRLQEDEMFGFFEWVAANIRLPFIVYNNPGTVGYDLPVEVLGKIASLPLFAGLKEASPDPIRFYRLMSEFGGSFPVIAAREDPLFFTLAAGSPGCLTATSAFAPQLLESLMHAFGREDLVAARDIFGRIQAYRRLLQPELNSGLPVYITYTKAAMDLIGLAGGRPHFPMKPLGAVQRERLADVMQSSMGLELVRGT